VVVQRMFQALRKWVNGQGFWDRSLCGCGRQRAGLFSWAWHCGCGGRFVAAHYTSLIFCKLIMQPSRPFLLLLRGSPKGPLYWAWFCPTNFLGGLFRATRVTRSWFVTEADVQEFITWAVITVVDCYIAWEVQIRSQTKM
jgi:hypothetical protein